MKFLEKPRTKTGFTLFPRLPAELKIEVWKEAAVSTPRVIKLRLNQDWGLRGKGWSSSTQPPALLHACREARHEGLKAYELCFPLEHDGVVIDPPKIYFNPKIDTLYLDMNAVESSRGPWDPDRQALATIRHLAVQTDVWTLSEDNGHRVHGNPFTLEALSEFRQLKTLTLVRDFTTMNEREREITKRPIPLRQRLTDEKNLLTKIVEKLDSMKRSDEKRFHEILAVHVRSVSMLSKGIHELPTPAIRYTRTPAIRLLEYREGYPDDKDTGDQHYSNMGNWEGNTRGVFVRLPRGWQWIIPRQWKNDEGGLVSEAQSIWA